VRAFIETRRRQEEQLTSACCARFPATTIVKSTIHEHLPPRRSLPARWQLDPPDGPGLRPAELGTGRAAASATNALRPLWSRDDHRDQRQPGAAGGRSPHHGRQRRGRRVFQLNENSRTSSRRAETVAAVLGVKRGAPSATRTPVFRTGRATDSFWEYHRVSSEASRRAARDMFSRRRTNRKSRDQHRRHGTRRQGQVLDGARRSGNDGQAPRARLWPRG